MICSDNTLPAVFYSCMYYNTSSLYCQNLETIQNNHLTKREGTRTYHCRFLLKTQMNTNNNNVSTSTTVI